MLLSVIFHKEDAKPNVSSVVLPERDMSLTLFDTFKLEIERPAHSCYSMK